MTSKETKPLDQVTKSELTYQCTTCGKKLSKTKVHKWLGKFYCWNCMNGGGSL